MKIVFEPWSLGDAVIAASICRSYDQPTYLGINSRWHRILKYSLRDYPKVKIFPVDLPYTTRSRLNKFSLDGVEALDIGFKGDVDDLEVCTIRGDFRDYWAAKRIFPGAKIKASGWIGFMARRISFANLPFSSGLMPITNRYQAWAKQLEMPFERLVTNYEERRERCPKSKKIIIHIGAQWASRQYPNVNELYKMLEERGYQVTIIGGPEDHSPVGIDTNRIKTFYDESLVDKLLETEYVITNDSGPMHLAAFLGCRTFAIGRTANILEWIPPATPFISSSKMPHGYRPHKYYGSDVTLGHWPEAGSVVNALVDFPSITNSKSMEMAPHDLFFEPWSLGDAIIASAIFNLSSSRSWLAIHPKWHQLIIGVFGKEIAPRLVSASLPYTGKNRSYRFSLFGARINGYETTSLSNSIGKVFSIRGDFRDFLAAQRFFSFSKVKMIGWLAFWARRLSVLDFPFRLGLLKVKNRYQAWAEVSGVSFQEVEIFYRAQRTKNKNKGKVVIHAGALWRSKQYPHVKELVVELEKIGKQVQIIAAPLDRLPEGISSTSAKLLTDLDLVHELRQAELVITNDSGPMHLSAVLGCKTLAIARTSNILEWLPPGVSYIATNALPRGYKPDSDYSSDKILSGWPSVSQVLDKIKDIDQ